MRLPRPQTLARIRYRAQLSLLLMLAPVVILELMLFVWPMTLVVSRSAEGGFTSYGEVLGSPLFVPIVENTGVIAGLSTGIALVLAYIYAALLWRSSPRGRTALVFFLLLPFWTGAVVKLFAWTVLLHDRGVLNQLLLNAGLLAEPLHILDTRWAVVIGMVHYVLPYGVLPIYAAMVGVDPRLEQASRSLGASGPSTFRSIILPLTLPGVYAGLLLMLIICLGFFLTPVVLGSPGDLMIANLVDYYARDVVNLGAASAAAMLVVAVVVIFILAVNYGRREGQYGRT